MNELEKRTKAWIGDAVLALYSREWILLQTDIPIEDRSDIFIHMTSNDFLACIGEPTQVEADIGIMYEKEGKDAAYQFIESKLLPVFKKQRANRRKARTNARKRNH